MSRRTHWKRCRIGAVLFCVHFLVIACGRPADRLILFPSRGYIDAGPAKREVIHVDSRALEIWTARSRSLAAGDLPQAYALEFCGNAMRAEQIVRSVAERWAKHPIEAWVVNYPGYGGSEGDARLDLIPPSALAAYDEIARRAPGKPIFLEATSLGTTAALYVADHRPTPGLILQNPPPLRSLILGRHGWWNAWLLAFPIAMEVPKELDSIANAKRIHAPAVFLLADQDEVVPPKYQKSVVDAYAGEKQIISLPGATHNDPVSGPAAADLSAAIDRLWENARPKN